MAEAQTFKNQARQGDVYIVRVEKLPDGLVKMKRSARGEVFAEGTATGHAHVVKEKSITQYKSKTDARLNRTEKLRTDSAMPAITWIKVTRPVTLRHDEHDPIRIGPGVYEVRRQRERVLGVTQQVQD